ncbi:coat protein [Fusarium mangiferae partitivirus 2]|nr:coat protein [Fusarium mangiferae partitivirus 2]
MSSTIAPSDSASAVSGKKSKPGKAERAARRAATNSVAGNPASEAKAMTFASSVSVPKPQPGKFPVVFQTGAGEPSRDTTFAYDPEVLSYSLRSFLPAYKEHPKYAEFLSYTDYTDKDFEKQLVAAALLRLAQQVVHSHVNLGLPQGDFAPVASTEVRVPGAVSAFCHQHGEFAVPALGTRFLYKDYSSTVKALIWAAKQVDSSKAFNSIIEQSWLPTSANDGHTKQVIAHKLNQFLSGSEVQYQSSELEASILSGTVPDGWDTLKPFFGDDDTKRDRFDFLFKTYADAPTFVTEFTKTANKAVLNELELKWDKPSAGHVDWTFNAKELFTSLSDSWAQKSAAYAHFFELSSSQVNRSAASGSQAQLAVTSTRDAVTIVKTHLALSAPEFFWLRVFPPPVSLLEASLGTLC